MIKIPTWKRILGGLVAYLSPAVIYILFTNGTTLDFIPFLYLFSSVTAAFGLVITVFVNEDTAL